MVKRHGHEHGLGRYARHIQEMGDGSLYVSNPQIRQEILDLRTDAGFNALMAGEFAQDNKAHLERNVGGQVGPTELYLAHFFGAAGATTFLRGLRADPDQSGASLFPRAAAANPSVFHGTDGAARSLKQIYDWAAQRMERGVALAGEVDTLATGHRGHFVTDGVAPQRAGFPVVGLPPPGGTAELVPPGAPAGGRTLSMWTVLTASALPVPGEPGEDGVPDRT